MKISLGLFLSLLFIYGCGEGDFKGFTNGQLTKTGGAPISGAEIHVSYPNLSNQFKKKPTATISFSLPNASILSFKSSRFGSNEFIEGFEEIPFTAGSHTIAIQDSLYTTGLYLYQIQSESFSAKHKFLMLRAEAQLLDNIMPLAITDNSGDFTLQTSVFGVGEELISYNESGVSTSLTIGSMIEFIAIKNGEIIARKKVRISNGLDNEISLIVK